MAKSLSHGTTSSVKEVALNDALSRLSIFSSSGSIQKIISALGAKANLHLVGGTVRDFLLGFDACDLDLATILKPEDVISGLTAQGIRVIETGIIHGTVTALVDEQSIEITTFRKPSAREKSQYSQTIQEDLEGRDFTINALAFDVTGLKLIDPFGGLEDLKNNILRAVANPPDRIAEDPLRIMRMFRFGQAAGRVVDDDTLAAASELAHMLEKVSVERIRVELEKILVSEFPANAIRSMAEEGVLSYVLPELLPSIGFEQNDFHTEDVFEHTLTVVENAPPELRLRLAALFHDIGKPESFSVDEEGRRHFYSHEEIGYRITKTVMKRLRFSNDDIDAVGVLVRLHMRPMDCGPAGVRRLIRDLGPLFDDWKKLKTADAPPIMDRQDFDERFTRFEEMVSSEKVRLEKIGKKLINVTGEDLKAIGVQPGPGMGKILKALENLVLDNPDLNTRECLLENASRLKQTL